jgi:hypothetical protein
MAELPAGQIVVTRRSGAAPAAYVVAEGDPKAAAELVQSAMMFGERVTEVYPLPAWAVEAYGLAPRSFTPWRLLP